MRHLTDLKLCYDRQLVIVGGLIKESIGSRAGQFFTSASGETIPNEGEVTLATLTEEGIAMKASFQIAGIRRPLLSVGEISEAGNMIYFGRKGGVIYNLESGTKTYFGKEGGIYVIDLYVRKNEAGF